MMEGIKRKLTTLKKQVEEAEDHAAEQEKEKKEHEARAAQVSVHNFDMLWNVKNYMLYS